MQQRTSALPVSHPVRSLLGLARQIALPHEFAPERFPSFPALERTALMAFNSPVSLNLPASTQVKVLLSRQATYPVWADQSYTGSSYSSTYQFDWAGGTGGSSTSEYCVNPMLASWVAGNRGATSVGPGVSGSNSSLGPYAILGTDSALGLNAPFTWVPGNWAATVVLGAHTPIATGTAILAEFEIWSSPGESGTINVNSNIVAGNFTVGITLAASVTGYWIRPKSMAWTNAGLNILIVPYASIVTSAGTHVFTASAASQGTVAVTGVATTGFAPLVFPSEFANSTLPWYSTRTTASAFLGTNVSQVLNKGGTVLAGRVAPQVVNPFNVGSSYINALHPAEKAFLPLETGVYTYCPPSTDLAEFWDYTVNTSSPAFGSGPASCPVYRLDNTSLVNVMFITATSVAEQLACNVDWHVEFRTSSALFNIGLCTMTLETLHQAQVSLASVGFFFENPEHKHILNSVISAAKKYGPAALGMVNPVAGKMASAVINLSRKPQNSMKATSAKASGMMPSAPKAPQQQQKKKKGAPVKQAKKRR